MLALLPDSSGIERHGMLVETLNLRWFGMLAAGCINEHILSMSLTKEELEHLGIGDGGATNGRVIAESASINAGEEDAWGIGADGYVGCWAQNSFDDTLSPDGTFSSVSAGRGYACGARIGGIVACWGDDADGEAFPPGSQFASVSAGTTMPVDSGATALSLAGGITSSRKPRRPRANSFRRAPGTAIAARLGPTVPSPAGEPIALDNLRRPVHRDLSGDGVTAEA